MRFARMMTLVLMILYVPMILGLVAGMLWVGYSVTAMVFRGMLFPFVIVLTIALDMTIVGSSLILLIGLLPLFFRAPPESPPGIEIREVQHPRLFKVIRRVSARLGTSAPDVFYLHGEHDAGIGDLWLRDANGRAHGRRALSFGVPFVLELRVDEFLAVLCHEIAHASGGDTLMSRRASRFFTSLGIAIGGHSAATPDEQGPGLFELAVQYFLYGYFLLFAYFYQMDNRARELRADRLAAEVCGAQAMRGALIRIAALCEFNQLNSWFIADQLAQRELPVQNLFDQYRTNRAGITSTRFAAAENQVMLEPHTVWSSHPRITDRIRVISTVDSKGISSARPATELFTDWPRLERMISDSIMEVMQIKHMIRLRKLDRALRER